MNRNSLRRTAARAVLAVSVCAPLLGCDYIALVTGKEPCGTWTAQKRENGKLRETGVEWAKGYFPAFYAGYTKAGGKAGPLHFPKDNARMLEALDNYCAAKPNVAIGDAARDVMLDALRKPHP